MSDLVKTRIIIWSIVTVYGAALFVAGLFIKQDFTYVGFMNSVFYTGGIVLFSGLLVLVAHWGAFDIFVYGFKDVFYHMNPNPDKTKKYKDYPEYLQAKKDIRAQRKLVIFWPFLAWGSAYLVAMFVLRMIYLANNGI